MIRKILVLPDAGRTNPFQRQLIAFLEKSNFQVAVGARRRFFATLSAVRRHRPDALYFDWVQSFILGKTLLLTLLKCLCFYLEILYVKKSTSLPIVHTLHNVQNHAGRWAAVERLVYGWFLRRCDRIRVYSETTRDKVVRIFQLDPRKIFVIQDVPYHHFYPAHATRRQSRSYLQLPEEAFVYLFFGIVRPYKGVTELVQAFGRVAGPRDYLVIAGFSDLPEYGAQIRELSSKYPNVIFHNYFIEEENVQYYYKAADVVVLPFRNVEHSGSVDLALSFAKPVITLNTPLLGQLLHAQAALLFNDPQELPVRLQLARQLPLGEIGEANFRVADSVNYRDLLQLFR